MQAKLNPTGAVGATDINFLGFQKICDFTAAGGEASLAVTVDGDTDKKYKICVFNTNTTYTMLLRLNNDSGTNYGFQYLYNAATISAARSTGTAISFIGILDGLFTANLSTPTGFLKTLFYQMEEYTSGTTLLRTAVEGNVWNSTANVTSLNFLNSTGNMTAGTRITVFARRSNV